MELRPRYVYRRSPRPRPRSPEPLCSPEQLFPFPANKRPRLYPAPRLRPALPPFPYLRCGVSREQHAYYVAWRCIVAYAAECEDDTLRSLVRACPAMLEIYRYECPRMTVACPPPLLVYQGSTWWQEYAFSEIAALCRFNAWCFRRCCDGMPVLLDCRAKINRGPRLCYALPPQWLHAVGEITIGGFPVFICRVHV